MQSFGGVTAALLLLRYIIGFITLCVYIRKDSSATAAKTDDRHIRSLTQSFLSWPPEPLLVSAPQWAIQARISPFTRVTEPVNLSIEAVRRRLMRAVAREPRRCRQEMGMPGWLRRRCVTMKDSFKRPIFSST